MTEQSTQQSDPSPTATEPPDAPEPTSQGLDEPMFPLPKMDLELREGFDEREAD